MAGGSVKETVGTLGSAAGAAMGAATGAAGIAAGSGGGTGSGSKPGGMVGGAGGAGGSAAGIGWALVAKMSASWSKAARLPSPMGERGELGDGLSRAWTRSWAAAMAMSVDEAVGILT